MTNEEAIAVLKEKYCGIGANDLFVFRKAIEALESADKYRWHDLRKDPEDLPKENKMYIVTIECYDGSRRTDFRWYERTKVRGKIVWRWKYPWETITDEEITHWMERPPAAGGEDK